MFLLDFNVSGCQFLAFKKKIKLLFPRSIRFNLSNTTQTFWFSICAKRLVLFFSLILRRPLILYHSHMYILIVRLCKILNSSLSTYFHHFHLLSCPFAAHNCHISPLIGGWVRTHGRNAILYTKISLHIFALQNIQRNVVCLRASHRNYSKITYSLTASLTTTKQ